jgi:hypothetical protein
MYRKWWEEKIICISSSECTKNNNVTRLFSHSEQKGWYGSNKYFFGNNTIGEYLQDMGNQKDYMENPQISISIHSNSGLRDRHSLSKVGQVLLYPFSNSEFNQRPKLPLLYEIIYLVNLSIKINKCITLRQWL